MDKGIIIALHSLPRAGKDTLAKELIQHFGFKRFSFAGPLYEEVSAAFGAAVELLEQDEWKKRPQASLALRNCNEPEFVELMLGLGFTKEEPLTSRIILQKWGTEYRRHQDKDYWTLQMWERLQVHFDCKGSISVNGARAVITDTRVYRDAEGALSYDEADLLEEFSHTREVAYRMIELERDGCEGNGHSSDERFPVEKIHRTVYNTDTPTVMLNQLTAYLQSEGMEL